MPSKNDEQRDPSGSGLSTVGARFDSDRSGAFHVKHKVFVGIASIVLAIAVITTGMINPVVLLDADLGINLTGLIAMLAVAAWRFGPRRN